MGLILTSPDGSEPSNSLFTAGSLAFRAGDYYESARCFNAAYENSPYNLWYFVNYATSIRNAGHLDFAMRAYTWLLERFPRYPELRQVFQETQAALFREQRPGFLPGISEFQSRPGFPPTAYMPTLDFHDVSISLCMIVRDEEKNIERAISSIGAYMNEIIVVDTGSKDSTVDIVRSLGITPYFYEWNDDFSAARNFSLSKATSDWILILDADETISFFDVFYLKELIVSNPALWGFTLDQRDYFEGEAPLGGYPCVGDIYEESKPYRSFGVQKICRLFQNREKVRFCLPVYEMVEESIKLNGGEFGYTDIPIHHYGRLGPREKQIATRKYYVSILEKRLDSDDPAFRKALYCGNMARAFMFIGEPNRAKQTILRGLKLNPVSVELVSDLGDAYVLGGRDEKALSCYMRAIDMNPSRPIERPYLEAARIYFKQGKMGRARDLCARCLSVIPTSAGARGMLENIKLFQREFPFPEEFLGQLLRDG